MGWKCITMIHFLSVGYLTWLINFSDINLNTSGCSYIRQGKRNGNKSCQCQCKIDSFFLVYWLLDLFLFQGIARKNSCTFYSIMKTEDCLQSKNGMFMIKLTSNVNLKIQWKSKHRYSQQIYLSTNASDNNVGKNILVNILIFW